MTIRITASVLAAVLGLSACDDFAGGRPMPPQPAAGPAVPPSPDLPMTAAKAREIIGDLPLTCHELASLKADMAVCDERQGRTVDHAALRTELRDLRWTLQSLPREQATARCTAVMEPLRQKPKPQACWDI